MIKWLKLEFRHCEKCSQKKLHEIGLDYEKKEVITMCVKCQQITIKRSDKNE